jgi:membrane protein
VTAVARRLASGPIKVVGDRQRSDRPEPSQ